MQKVNFEKALKRLEDITSDLESGELSLDDSLKLFEEGIKISRFCEKSLSETEKRIEILKTTDIDDVLQDQEDESKDRHKGEKNKKKQTKENNAEEKIDDISEENFLF